MEKESKKRNLKYNKNEKRVSDTYLKENTTKYGEFVCSEYKWLPIEKQKEQAKDMENMTKEEKDK